MLVLSNSLCDLITAGSKTVTTTHDEADQWVCSCICENPNHQAFYDQEDDTWVWYLLTWPYNFISHAFR